MFIRTINTNKTKNIIKFLHNSLDKKNKWPKLALIKKLKKKLIITRFKKKVKFLNFLNSNNKRQKDNIKKIQVIWKLSINKEKNRTFIIRLWA